MSSELLSETTEGRQRQESQKLGQATFFARLRACSKSGRVRGGSSSMLLARLNANRSTALVVVTDSFLTGSIAASGLLPEV
jgi:hypothetical protein